MPDRTSDAAQPCRVQVVSANLATLESLRAYLDNAGVHVHGSRRPALDACAQVTAIVMFPDDFAEAEVVSCLRQARAARPDLVLVTVTRNVRRFEGMTAGDGRPLRLIVLPRPAFGWTILESLRCDAPVTPDGPA
jgi:hypothetical protein